MLLPHNILLKDTAVTFIFYFPIQDNIPEAITPQVFMLSLVNYTNCFHLRYPDSKDERDIENRNLQP